MKKITVFIRVIAFVALLLSCDNRNNKNFKGVSVENGDSKEVTKQKKPTLCDCQREFYRLYDVSIISGTMTLSSFMKTCDKYYSVDDVLDANCG